MRSSLLNAHFVYSSQNGGKENEKKVIPNQPQIIIPFSKILEKQKMIEAKANVNKQ